MCAVVGHASLGCRAYAGASVSYLMSVPGAGGTKSDYKTDNAGSDGFFAASARTSAVSTSAVYKPAQQGSVSVYSSVGPGFADLRSHYSRVHGTYKVNGSPITYAGGSFATDCRGDTFAPDLVFSRLDGQPSGPITVKCFFQLTVSVQTNITQGSANWNANYQMRVRDQLWVGNYSGTNTNKDISFSEIVTLTDVPTDVGHAFGASGMITSDHGCSSWFANRATGYRQYLDMNLRVNLMARAGIGPENPPVFDLPEGYTANAPSRGLVNNRFVRPYPNAQGSFRGKCNLGVLSGSRTQVPFSVWQNGVAVSYGLLFPKSNGTYEVATMLPDGAYEIVFEDAGMLRVRRPVLLTSAPFENVDLDFFYGDIDRDNSVTVFDYSYLSDWFDKTSSDANWFAEDSAGVAPEDVDLDRDGAITVFDYAALSEGFDRTGDA